MIAIYDRDSAALALARELEPRLRAALEAELALLTSEEHDLTDHTDIHLIEPGDAETDIWRETGFSPLVEPIEGARFGEPGFAPGWDLLTASGGVFRIVFTFGSTFAAVLLVPDAPGVLPDLLHLCRTYAA